MDPITIDLSSVAGIVALTVALVHYLKGRLAGAPYLEKVPVAVYVVAVSLLLTWTAHDGIGILIGDRWELLQQAFLQALIASGAVEWWRAGKKPLEESEKARNAVAKRGGFYVLPILLAIGLSVSACASLGPRTGAAIVAAETAIHDAIGITVATGNRLCAAQILDAPRCIQFNEKLIPIIKDADAFNRAIASNSTAAIPSMVLALDRLVDDVVALMPSVEDRAAVILKVNEARAILRSIRGK